MKTNYITCLSTLSSLQICAVIILLFPLLIVIFALVISFVRQSVARRRKKKFIIQNPDYTVLKIAYSAFDGDSIINFYSVNGEIPAYYNGNLYLPIGDVIVRADFQITSLEKAYTMGNGPDAYRQFKSDIRFIWHNIPKNDNNSIMIHLKTIKGGDYTIKPNQRTNAFEVICIEGEKHYIKEFKK